MDKSSSETTESSLSQEVNRSFPPKFQLTQDDGIISAVNTEGQKAILCRGRIYPGFKIGPDTPAIIVTAEAVWRGQKSEGNGMSYNQSIDAIVAHATNTLPLEARKEGIRHELTHAKFARLNSSQQREIILALMENKSSPQFRKFLEALLFYPANDYEAFFRSQDDFEVVNDGQIGWKIADVDSLAYTRYGEPELSFEGGLMKHTRAKEVVSEEFRIAPIIDEMIANMSSVNIDDEGVDRSFQYKRVFPQIHETAKAFYLSLSQTVRVFLKKHELTGPKITEDKIAKLFKLNAVTGEIPEQ